MTSSVHRGSASRERVTFGCPRVQPAHTCIHCGTTYRLLVYRRLPFEHWVCAVCLGVTP